MKQRVFLCVLFLALFVLASTAYAQGSPRAGAAGANSSGNASATPVRTQAEQRFEFRADVIKKKASNTSRVMENTIKRLEGIATRIESRITKVESAGGNIAESRAALTEARSYLSSARASLSPLASVDFSTTDVRAKFNEAKAIAVEAKSHIRNAHGALMRAVSALKLGRTATTTPQN